MCRGRPVCLRNGTSDPKEIQQNQRPRMTTRLPVPAAAISFSAMLMACGTPSPHDYATEIEAWRTEREVRLKAEDGWLTLTGLFFLNEDDNSFGSSSQKDIDLRAGPKRAGIITLRDGRVGVRAVEGQTLLVDGRRVDAAQLWPFEGPDRPTITLGPSRCSVVGAVTAWQCA